jgi:Zn-dependent peptidase ImmA (M78 family)
VTAEDNSMIGGNSLYHNYSPERLEKKAEEILKIYKQGELLVTPQAMDVDHFAEFHLDAKIDFANLSQDKKTLGCTCFNDGVLMVWNDDRTKQYPLEVEKGYIFVDKEILCSEVEGRVRFTIIHECAHLILHRRFYYQKPGNVIPKIQCAVYQIEDGARRLPMTDEEVREWQANRLAAALIMPAKTVRMMMAERLGIAVDALSPVYLSDLCIREMADIYNVSKSAMSIRLEDLNLLLH